MMIAAVILSLVSIAILIAGAVGSVQQPKPSEFGKTRFMFEDL